MITFVCYKIRNIVYDGLKMMVAGKREYNVEKKGRIY